MKCVLAVVCVLALSGCFRHTYYVAGTTPATVHEQWLDHGLWGLVTFSDPLELRARCPAGVARIVDQVEVHQALIGLVTLGIYTPSTSYVHCSGSD